MPAAQEAAAGHDHLTAAYADAAVYAPADPVATRDEKFFYGLEVVLDGLEMRLPR
ncbi:hypothetical protein [Streptomyces sp. NBC_00691]|uniref:hypothetical protein n=1 Tax=Streptomyces sp. NBC_00691 TaxID=2903671 RepID=UPI002E365C04|nr:hypothetical protein [Streptomyces sp. NBC_00691]